MFKRLRNRRFLVAVMLLAGFAWAGWCISILVMCPSDAELELPIPGQPLLQSWLLETWQPLDIGTVTSCWRPYRSILRGRVTSVADGVIVPFSDASTFTGPSQRGLPPREIRRVRCALITAGRTETFVRFSGMPNGGWAPGDNPAPFERAAEQFFPGTLKSGERRLVYVEGDREFSASSNMKPEEFASENPVGRFLLVEFTWTHNRWDRE